MTGWLSRLAFCATLLGAAWPAAASLDTEAADGAPLLADTGQKMLLPSYFSPPGGYWTQLAAGAPTVGIAIINPASGPGRVFDPNYLAETRNAQARGVLVLGYVHTSYGQRNAPTVRAEIDRYYAWYGVDGIFLDEVSTDCRRQPYFQRLFDYVKAKAGVAKVVLNPGTNTSECYLSAADILVNFEGSYGSYAQWQPSGWELAHPRERFCQLIHGTPEADMPAAIALSKGRHAGWVYVTPDALPNPWDTLPPEPGWSDQLTLVGTSAWMSE